MKIFSTAGQPGKPKRSSALNCLLINQFATPGLGSLMGRRFIAGTIQLLMALGGFVMFIYGMMDRLYRQADELPPGPHPWMEKDGLLLFVASWFLAWVTSLSLVRHAPREETSKPIPPIIPPPAL